MFGYNPKHQLIKTKTYYDNLDSYDNAIFNFWQI